MQKHNQEGFFFHIIYVEPKHQRDEHNHAGASDFQHLIWVCWLSPVWYNVLDLIAINFNWSNRPWNFVQREISSTKLHKPLLTHLINYSTFSIYCIFLYLSFYLSWNNKHNMPKLLAFFSSIFSIKMATQKFTNSLFSNAADMAAVTIQSNNTVKLSTTRAIWWEKTNKPFSQPNIWSQVYELIEVVLVVF